MLLHAESCNLCTDLIPSKSLSIAAICDLPCDFLMGSEKHRFFYGSLTVYILNGILIALLIDTTYLTSSTTTPGGN